MSIKLKVFILITIFVSSMLLSTTATYVAISSQKNDARIINMTGKLRMLSQKIAMEALRISLQGFKGEATGAEKKRLRDTAALFDSGLRILKDGGLAENIPGERVVLTGSKGKARELLETVDIIWRGVGKELAVLTNPGTQTTDPNFISALNFILNENIALLRAADTTTNFFELKSKEKMAALRYIQIFSYLLILFLASMCWLYTRSGIVHPLTKLTSVVKKMANGDLLARSDISSDDEIGETAGYINRMAEELLQKGKALKDADAKLQLKKVKLIEALHIKSEFLAMVNHELKTPLTSILGFSHMLLDEDVNNLTDRQKLEISQIISSGEELLARINDLLDFSSLEARLSTLQFKEIDLSAMVDEIIGRVRSTCHSRNILLLKEIEKGLTALADEAKLRQIIMILLSNAVKFTKEGRIIVSAGRAKSDRCLINLAISDTGIGIGKKDASIIFEPFRQADGSNTRRYGGMGLGLAIAKRLVEMHGGEITFESRVGKGTTFYITLPA